MNLSRWMVLVSTASAKQVVVHDQGNFRHTELGIF